MYLLPSHFAAADAAADSMLIGQSFLDDPFVAGALLMGSKANVAFMGIGAPRRDSILIRRGTIVAWGELETYKERGAVGDINLRYFDIDGQLIESALNDRVIGLTLDEIRQIETVVGVAGGEAKYQAIHGAIRGQLIDVLVTDDVTTRRLLAETNE